ncbi:hypothetical protein, partial [Nocardia rhamnosiphila]
MKKAYLVVKDYGYNEIQSIAIMPDKKKAKEYARLLGSDGDVQTFEVLDEIPEHWTVFTSQMALHHDGRENSEGIYTSERTYWAEDGNFDPERYPSIEVEHIFTYDYSNQKPLTYRELLTMKGVFYQEVFAPQPEREPNTWSITIESLDKDEAERLAREHYDALKA